MDIWLKLQMLLCYLPIGSDKVHKRATDVIIDSDSEQIYVWYHDWRPTQ